MRRMPAKTTAPDKKQDFKQAFDGLRKILKPYDGRFRIPKDAPGNYLSESKSLTYEGKPVMFASITSKSYVAFHLFPVYVFPDLLQGMSPELKRRMQGKTCWNFKKADEPLFAELALLVASSIKRFETMGPRNLTRDDLRTLGKEKPKRKSR
jgi:hypothetical protein